MKADDAIHVRRVGMRWGRACERATIAREALHQIRGIKDLLPKDLADRVDRMAMDMSALELDLWGEEAATLPREKRSHR